MLMFEFFEHTADLGLRIQAGSFPRLMEEAGQGLTAMIVQNPDAIRPLEQRCLTVSSDSSEYLLFDWLSELLYLFESSHWLTSRFQVQLQNGQLSAELFGETFDPDRHHPAHEVKAITYHELSVEQQDDGWLATVIVDI